MKVRLKHISIAAIFTVLGFVAGYFTSYNLNNVSEYRRATELSDKELNCNRLSLDLKPTDVYCGDFWKYYFEYLPSLRNDN